LTQPPGGAPPGDTLQAVANIARFPWQNVAALFAQSQLAVRYEPALGSAPDAWTLALRYQGNGHEFDGPGNFAIDRDGNVWASNNYQFNPDPLVPACGGDYVLKLTPTGSDAPG